MSCCSDAFKVKGVYGTTLLHAREFLAAQKALHWENLAWKRVMPLTSLTINEPPFIACITSTRMLVVTSAKSWVHKLQDRMLARQNRSSCRCNRHTRSSCRCGPACMKGLCLSYVNIMHTERLSRRTHIIGESLMKWTRASCSAVMRRSGMHGESLSPMRSRPQHGLLIACPILVCRLGFNLSSQTAAEVPKPRKLF